MASDLQKKLKSRWDGFTPAELKIATYLLRNIGEIPFETAASLGRRVEVSAMTVGRFLRTLGYTGLNELKSELRGDAPWMQLYNDPTPAADGLMPHALHVEIRGLKAVYALASTPAWTSIVDLLARSERICMASFHHARFLGLGFVSLLAHVKSRTRFFDGQDGAYADMLLDSGPTSCIVLIEFRRYSKHFRWVADEASQRGIPLVIITDTQCHWARRLTPHVLALPVDVQPVWHNFGAATSLFSLLIGAVVQRQDDVLERIGEITQLRQRLVGYTEVPAAARAPQAKARAALRALDKKAPHLARGKPKR